MKPLLALALASFACFGLLPAPALAQPTAEVVDDDVCMVIVYGQDAPTDCGGKEIVVVARLPENERYRIPEGLRFSEDLANTAWAQRVESLELIGRFGTLSCSPAGAGGILGCTQDLINRAYGERRTGDPVRFSELIAAARADRLAQIDAAAAEQQAQVEQIEREYLDRLAREREAELPDENTEALPQPEPSGSQN